MLCVCAQSTASSMRFEDAFFTTQGERKRQRTPNSRFQNDYIADPSPRTSNCSKTNWETGKKRERRWKGSWQTVIRFFFCCIDDTLLVRVCWRLRNLRWKKYFFFFFILSLMVKHYNIIIMPFSPVYDTSPCCSSLFLHLRRYFFSRSFAWLCTPLL